jgi:hypothetical protein
MEVMRETKVNEKELSVELILVVPLNEIAKKVQPMTPRTSDFIYL